MAGLGGVDHGKNFFPNFLGLGLQAKDFFLICHDVIPPHLQFISSLILSKPEAPILKRGTSTASCFSRLMEI